MTTDSGKSGTPRTDALIANLDTNHDIAIAFVWRQMVNHARTLERELLAAQAAALPAPQSAVAEENDKRDAARYRWLRQKDSTAIVVMPDPPDDSWCPYLEQLDAAIDMEMGVEYIKPSNEPPDRCTGKEVATLLGLYNCPKCGADRTKEPCKNHRKHECLMVGTAQAKDGEWKCPDCGNGQNFNHRGCKTHKFDAARKD